jgi:hypothetical protein
MALVGGARAPIRPIRPRQPRRPQLNSIAYKQPARPRTRPVRRPPTFLNSGNLANRRYNNGGAQPFVTPKSTAPQAPAAPAAPPAPVAPEQRQSRFLDAQFFNDFGQAKFEADQQIGQLRADSGFERAALAEALRRLGVEQPRQEQETTTDANASGLLYSGALGRGIGDIRTDFLRRRSDAQTNFDRAEAQRNSEIGFIEGQLPFLQRQFELEALQRQIEADAESPLVDEGPDEPAAPPAPGAPAAARSRPRIRRRNRTAANRAASQAAQQAAAEQRREQQSKSKPKKRGRR